MRNSLLVFCFLGLTFNLKAQLESFTHFRELSAPRAPYSAIEIPLEVYSIAQPDLRDVRIFCVQENDTLEIPFIWKDVHPANSSQPKATQLFNVGKRNGNYSFEFETDGKEIDRVDLEFGLDEFDVAASLEGSNDGQTWTVIKERHRLISINNDDQRYQYSSITFPPARFSRYRVTLNQNEDLRIQHVTYKSWNNEPVEYRIIDSVKVAVNHDKEMKESTVTLDFDRYVPLSGLRFQVEQRDNFLRPVYIRGYRKERNGAAIYPDVVISQSMTLSSWEPTELHFDQVVVDSVVVVIRNFDDQPLDIQSIESFSNVKELIARTQEDGRYILTYGHSQIYAPVYDLEHFRNRIGTDVGSMDVGAEHLFDKMEEAEHSTVSHKWLWAVIVVAIVLIGIFTRKMMLPKE